MFIILLLLLFLKESFFLIRTQAHDLYPIKS